MIRANSSGSSNQTMGVSASSAAGESAEAEMEGQEDDPREFVVDEPEETSPVGDGLDLVRTLPVLYAGALVLNCP